MKILIFGRGVISTQYAWALEQAGHTVEFYVRKGKGAILGKAVALNLYDARKKMRGELIKTNWQIKLIEELPADHAYALILLSVQHYQLDSALEFLKDKLASATLLVFNNLWNEPLETIKDLPRQQVAFGFPAAGGGFDKNGVLNGAFFRHLTMGTFGTEPSAGETQAMNLFKESGFQVKLSNDFRSWLFGHFIVNAAMHLETLKAPAGKQLTKLLQTSAYWQNVLANGKELLPLLQARKIDLHNSPDIRLFKLPPWLLSLTVKLAMTLWPAVKIIFSGHNNEQELKSYSRDVLETAKQLNIPLPRFDRFKGLF